MLGAASSDRIDAVTDEVRAIFDRLERELSAHRPDSVISLLAKKAGEAPVAVPENAFRVLNLGGHYGDLSDGAYDITVAPLVRLWGFGVTPAPACLPPEKIIQERLRLVDYRRLALADGTAFLPMKGMAVDLGGIAKGYAVDRAFDFCRGAGVEDFLIDLSGNIRVSGRPQRGEDWRIGVRDPFDRFGVIGKLTLESGMALATSGSYERFVEIEGRRYSHIIDPRTGYPVTGTAGVTVLSSGAIEADGLSTPFFVRGLRGASELLRKIPSAEILLVPDKRPVEIWMTPRFAGSLVPIPELSGALRLLNAGSPNR